MMPTPPKLCPLSPVEELEVEELEVELEVVVLVVEVAVELSVELEAKRDEPEVDVLPPLVPTPATVVPLIACPKKPMAMGTLFCP